MKFYNNLRYLLEYLIISFFFLIYKILGLKSSSHITGKIFECFGPLFRSKKIIEKNLKIAFPSILENEINSYSNKMWNFYGKLLSEYTFLKDFRKNKNRSNIKIIGKEILEQIKLDNERVIFVSGHFDNFELMAMMIEKNGIDLAAIYRPLNNFFLNPKMEMIRKKYICKNQIKKGLSSTRNLVKLFNKGTSIALMIDQRVSEGIKAKFFGKEAYTTTIPAQFVKKYNCRIVPIYIERVNNFDFTLKIYKPISYDNNANILEITENLNHCLEKMIRLNPAKWIWTHNRWK